MAIIETPPPPSAPPPSPPPVGYGAPMLALANSEKAELELTRFREKSYNRIMSGMYLVEHEEYHQWFQYRPQDYFVPMLQEFLGPRDVQSNVALKAAPGKVVLIVVHYPAGLAAVPPRLPREYHRAERFQGQGCPADPCGRPDI